MIPDEYLTIARESLAETKIKGSRFIGECCLVVSSDEALDRLEAVRKREHAATHHCYAWIVGLGQDQKFKYSDDDEPSGTAGKPIFDQIGGVGLINILVVVTRYYGGTKLGTGGLARAYSEAARLALQQAASKLNYLTTLFDVKLDFTYYDRWLKRLNQLEANVLKSDYADSVAMRIEIRRSRADELKKSFMELTSGQGEINLV